MAEVEYRWRDTDGGMSIISDPAPLVFINEASSSNSSFEDEDGDSPDWFELYNSDTSAINLTGWSITDDILEPAKWVFPNTAGCRHLPACMGIRQRQSSEGNIQNPGQPGDNFRYLLPQATPSRELDQPGL